MTKFSQEAFRTLLDSLSEGKSMAQSAALACSSRSKIAWVWIRNSRREKEANTPLDECKYVVHNWPESGEHHHLADAYEMALSISKLDFHLEVINEIRESTRPVLEGGAVMYEKDPFLLAKFKDAEEAAFFGYEDFPYKHNERGERIELRVRDRTSAQLTLAALKALIKEWNVPSEQKVTVDKRVLHHTLGERRPPQVETEMRRTFTEKLAELRANGPKNPHPSHPVQVFKAIEEGPKENVSNSLGDDAAKPLNAHPRAYIQPSLPAPKREPQPDYGRRAPSLNSEDRKDAMPSGGFSVTRGGKPT